MKSIIMAGGSGTRLWPFSRRNFPKQFLSIGDQESFLQMTARRLSGFSDTTDIYVVAGSDYRHTITDQMGRIFNSRYEGLIQEPMGRNTAPAIALSIKFLLANGAKPTDAVFVSPSDHVIEPVADFVKAVKDAEPSARDHIVTFGIVPDKPETGYGYIELGEPLAGEVLKVQRFVEKPNLEKAKEYLQSGRFMWNSGMFLFTIQVMLSAFQKFAPALYDFVQKGTVEEALKNYSALDSISIDYAVMEKAPNIACRRLSIKWNDIGSWDSYYELLPKDANGNAVVGDVEMLNSRNSLVIAEKHLTAVIGVQDIAVIETPDAILVSDRRHSQDVKEIVTKLKKDKRKEADEHATTYRPWGSYTVLEESERYKIKKIVVNQGEKLSLQRHQHRSEHWIVVKGTALVEIGGKEQYIHENESAYVPKSVVHRLSNPGKLPLEMIEVQNGEYVGEDDIERLEDNYGRCQ